MHGKSFPLLFFRCKFKRMKTVKFFLDTYFFSVLFFFREEIFKILDNRAGKKSEIFEEIFRKKYILCGKK